MSNKIGIDPKDDGSSRVVVAQEMSRNNDAVGSGEIGALDHRGTVIDPRVYQMDTLEFSKLYKDLATIPGIACCPFTVMGSWYVLQPRREAVVMHCGQVTQKIEGEGCHFINCFCRDIKEIETSQISYDMKNQKITDCTGNPVLVSAILTYRFTDPVAALFNVHNPKHFVTTQASAVLKEVVGSFSYEELKLDTDIVSERAVEILQGRVAVAGAKVLSMNLNELNYAQEIAASMLKKQQAEALIQARELLVQGAVDISKKMMESLDAEKVEFTAAQKSNLVSNLIVMAIGDSGSHDH